MKKFFALLMTLALLAPMGLVADAAGTVEAKPFYAIGWSDLDREKFPYTEGVVTMSIDVGASGNIVLSYGDISISSGNINATKLDNMVRALKKEMDSRPDGMRYIHFFGPRNALQAKIEHVIYLDYGADRLKELTSALFEKYHEAGGKVDGAIMCTLYAGMSSYYICKKNDTNPNNAIANPMVYKQIVDDPRYATEVRPLLEERGFKFYEDPTDYTPEIYGISGNAGSDYSKCAAIWDTVMRIRLDNYMTEWCYKPMSKYFPDVYVSDYQSVDNDTWLKGVNDNGAVLGGGGNSLRAGNTSCQNFYSERPTGKFFTSDNQSIYKNPPTYTEAIYENTPFNCFMYDMNVAKQVYLSTDGGNVCYWVARHDSNPEDTTAITNTPYYSEQVYHLNLQDPKPFVAFLYRGYFNNQDEFDRCAGVVNDLMAELTRVAGFADRKPIVLPQNWNSEFVLSGMYAGGRNIWRITPNIDEVSKEDFKVAANDPTFRVKGQTVTFPGGKIIEDATVSQIGTCGYWVETAADVTPIVVNDTDRFDQFPAYTEDFESYEPGTKLSTTNVRDQGVWMIQPKGSDLLVSAQGNNKTLSVTGNSVLKNTLIPQNITAADSYAKDQSWQITVTIPEGLGGEIVLLNYEGSKLPCKDGGFKIAEGKLYYSTVGTGEDGQPLQQYNELCDIAPGTYTLKRVLNLHNAENYTCDYILLDAEGKTVQAKNVSIPTFIGSVTAIRIACSNVTGTVLLDDFMLKLTGAAAELDVYDVTFGMELTEQERETPRSAATAYHLSWMNATAQEESAAVVAAFYDGETLLEEKIIKNVKMTPGCDGTEFGTVDVAEGQRVKVYLKTSLSGSSQSDVGGAEKGGLHPIVIAVIAAAAVVVGVVIVLLLPKKKTPENTGNDVQNDPEK